MDVGNIHSLLTTQGEIVFNDFTGDATANSLAGLDVPIWPGPGVSALFPEGLPDGNGYLMQFISGAHGAPIRNPVDVRPHKHGGIVHKFYASAKYFSLEGLIIADDPTIRQVLYDYLAGWIHASMQTDSRYFFAPPGQSTRFMTVRNYDAIDIVGPSGSPGASPDGIAGPKQYVAQFVAANPFSYTYTERDYGSADGPAVAGGDSIFVANDGTVETWPVIEVFAPASGPGFLAAFTLDNGTFHVEWAGHVNPGHWIEVDMYNETLYMDGNSTNELGGLNDTSDFWSIPPGGATVSVTPGADHIWIKTNDAWV